jgi:PEP-CTERM motif-containing protein
MAPMRTFVLRTAFVVLALGWSPIVSSAHAASIAITTATLDWTGFTFQVSDGLSIDAIVYANLGSSTDASTNHGPTDSDSGATSSSAFSSYLNALGSGIASGDASNGALTSSSGSASFGTVSSLNSAAADAYASTAFWLYGSGQGTLTVEVPYELFIDTGQSSAADLAMATAFVSLQLGPGAGWYASDSLSSLQAGTGSIHKTGTLTLSRSFVDPVWGPLVYIGAQAKTEAITAVPEPSTLGLVGLGALSVLRARRKAARNTPVST